MNSPRASLSSACVLAFVALAASGWLGCSQPNATPSVESPADSPASGIEVQSVDRAAYDAIRESLRGNVVLVDFWATWCTPCLEQLPHSVELADQEKERGLAVVTVSLDDPDDRAPIRAALDRVDAGNLTNLVSSFGGSSRSIEEFDVTGGAIPHYKLYDRDGKLRRSFGIDPSAERQFTPADIDAAVQELLAE